MTKSILFIVEGDRDRSHIRRITQVMDLKAEIVTVSANIYMLYNILKSEDFNLNITDVLLEMKGMHPDDKLILKKKAPFLYTYLFFDLDPHHNHLPLHQILETADEMLEHFNDETDNTVGKLYVDYPMIESLWDYDSDNPDSYMSRNIAMEDVGNYKQIVGKRGTPMNISKYDLAVYRNLALLNIKKSNHIINHGWVKPPYAAYISDLDQNKLFSAQALLLSNTNSLGVLSSIPLFMVDYWGNENGFYDSL